MSEPDAKRQRILDDIILTDQNLGLDEDQPDESEPMSYEELINVGYSDCYACKYMNVENIIKNEKYLKLMKLYTDNASTITRDAIFNKVKEFFDKYIKSDLIEIEKAKLEIQGKDIPPDNQIKTEDWTIECIREHFDRHTNFPTDEIITQLRIKRALRTRLSNNLIEVKSDGKQVFNHNNIKLLVTIEKEIQALLRLKKEIPNMVGYNHTLDF
jgi:hypothetical protein